MQQEQAGISREGEYAKRPGRPLYVRLHAHRIHAARRDGYADDAVRQPAEHPSRRERQPGEPRWRRDMTSTSVLNDEPRLLA